MSILPGIYASQISGHLSTNSYESIATVTVGAGGSSSISFTSIPSTYKHLQIRGFANSNRGTYPLDDLRMQVGNGSVDTGANYSTHRLFGDGASASASANTSQSYIILDTAVATAAAGSSIFAASVIDLLDYANTSKNKTIRALNGADWNGTVAGYGGRVALHSGLWMNTSAINAITFTQANGTQFNQYTQFALYGIKGA